MNLESLCVSCFIHVWTFAYFASQALPSGLECKIVRRSQFDRGGSGFVLPDVLFLLRTHTRARMHAHTRTCFERG